MTYVVVDGPLEYALKRFNRKVEKAGVLKTLRCYRYFVKPGMRKRLKAERARQRRLMAEAKWRRTRC